MDSTPNMAPASSPRRVFTSLLIGLAGLAFGVGLMAFMFAPLTPRWATPPRHAEQQPTLQRAYPLLPLQLTPEQREARIEKDYRHLSEEIGRLHSYRDRLEEYLGRKHVPGPVGDVSREERKTLQEVLDRVRDHIHRLETERDSAYEAWVETKKR